MVFITDRALIFIIALSIIFSFSAQKISAAVSFNINSSQSTISKDDEVSISVSISDLASCAKCYLQAAFTSSSSSPKYFGFTQNNNNEWYKYVSSADKEVIQASFYSFEPINSSWSGMLKTKIDPSDSDYKGGGNYYLKVARYTGNSSSPASWSNNLQITILDNSPTLTSTQSFTPTPTVIPTKTVSPTSTIAPTKKITLTPKITLTSTVTTSKEDISLTPTLAFDSSDVEENNDDEEIVLAKEILGENIATKEGEMITPTNVSVKTAANQKKSAPKNSNNFFPNIILSISIILLSSCAILVYQKYKKIKEKF